MGDAQGRRQEQAEARLGQGGESRDGNCPPTFGRIRGTSPQRAGPWCGTVYRVTGGVEFEATRGGSFEVGVTLRVPAGQLTLKPLPLSCSRSPSVSMWELEARPASGPANVVDGVPRLSHRKVGATQQQVGGERLPPPSPRGA